MIGIVGHDVSNRSKEFKEMIESLPTSEEIIFYFDESVDDQALSYLSSKNIKCIEAPTQQYEKIQFILNNCKNDYLCINSTDDPIFKEKISVQREFINDYDVVLSGFITSSYNYGYPAYGHYGKYLTNCFYTGWMINKNAICDVSYKNFHYDYGIEQAILAKLTNDKKVGIVLNPLFKVVEHQDQLGNTYTKERAGKEFSAFVNEFKQLDLKPKQVDYIFKGYHGTKIWKYD